MSPANDVRFQSEAVSADKELILIQKSVILIFPQAPDNTSFDSLHFCMTFSLFHGLHESRLFAFIVLFWIIFDLNVRCTYHLTNM